MDTASIELLVGVFLPPVIDLINRFVADTTIRYLISIAVCLVVGALFNLKDLNPQDFLQSAAIVFAASQTIYAKFYKDSGLQKVVRD